MRKRITNLYLSHFFLRVPDLYNVNSNGWAEADTVIRSDVAINNQ